MNNDFENFNNPEEHTENTSKKLYELLFVIDSLEKNSKIPEIKNPEHTDKDIEEYLEKALEDLQELGIGARKTDIDKQENLVYSYYIDDENVLEETLEKITNQSLDNENDTYNALVELIHNFKDSLINQKLSNEEISNLYYYLSRKLPEHINKIDTVYADTPNIDSISKNSIYIQLTEALDALNNNYLDLYKKLAEKGLAEEDYIKEITDNFIFMKMSGAHENRESILSFLSSIDLLILNFNNIKNESNSNESFTKLSEKIADNIEHSILDLITYIEDPENFHTTYKGISTEKGKFDESIIKELQEKIISLKK